MISSIAQSIVFLFGITICLLSLWGIFCPNRLIKLVKGAMHEGWGMYVAVLARVLLGVSLILAAPDSKFPMTFEILGWLTLVAAVVLPFIGRDRLSALIAWFERRPNSLIRLWTLFGVLSGGFLIYGISWAAT